MKTIPWLIAMTLTLVNSLQGELCEVTSPDYEKNLTGSATCEYTVLPRTIVVKLLQGNVIWKDQGEIPKKKKIIAISVWLMRRPEDGGRIRFAYCSESIKIDKTINSNEVFTLVPCKFTIRAKDMNVEDFRKMWLSVVVSATDANDAKNRYWTAYPMYMKHYLLSDEPTGFPRSNQEAGAPPAESE
ncbi:MAG: hypothetical protein B9S32_17065 [Verrucomicrobia bacterium Tous-C9LFEB]|nr:MAG: hypothetical protein B9S32_17065 [Verrucomicrobia bacterium Tous-C9LFEB]